MRTLVLFPIAYLAGVQGFVFFAPYLIIVLGTMQVARMARSRHAVPVRTARDPSQSEKHPA